MTANFHLCSREAPHIHGAIDSPSDHNELKATDEMCLHCFDVLLKYILQEKMTSQEVDFLQTLSPNITCPLFVTWDIRKMNAESKSVGSTDNHESGEANDTFILRGCIGSLAPKTLKSALGEYALASALRDGRFRPIVQNEVPLLRVAVSLLVKYEECNHAHDWEVGTHGIIIKFSHGNVEYSGRWLSYEDTSYFGLKLLIQFAFNHSATYLPEVAFEQGWTQERAVESLVRKAGFNGVISVDFLCEIKCVRYQSSKQKLTYSNYIAALGHDPIQSLNDELRSSSSSPRHRTWKDIFHL